MSRAGKANLQIIMISVIIKSDWLPGFDFCSSFLFISKALQDMTYRHIGDSSQVNESGEVSRLVRVEIDEEKLLQLLKAKQLCAADMRCLDCESKHCLLRLLLQACVQDLCGADRCA
jgi:hypothetical protein